MKQVVGLSLLFVLGVLFLSQTIFRTTSTKTIVPTSPSLTPLGKSTIRVPQKEYQYLFVPYWSLTGKKIPSDSYDELIYFGIAPDEKGLNTSEIGYKNIDKFLSALAAREKRFLTIRMIDPKVDPLVLEDKALQTNIIDQSIVTAKKFGFDGIVLDFELSALSFSSVVKNISDFYIVFAKSVKEKNLQFYITLYGDTFYRARPYDVKVIGEYADKVLILAYDFHKARENPGPNFPLHGKDVYGYDFPSMINDFTKALPKQKLVVVFGMFGYDWKIDSQQRGITTASPFSFYAMKEKFVTHCIFTDCVVKRDDLSSETSVRYTDSDSQKHIVWFEDMESVAKKKQFLQEKGMYEVSFWAYSYF